jgi:carboxyl-terminal processing protease
VRDIRKNHSMPHRFKFTLIFLILLVVLACKIEAGFGQPTTTPKLRPSYTRTASPSATPLPTDTPTATTTTTPTITASYTPSPTASFTPTLLPSSTQTWLPGTPTPTPLPLAFQLQVFEALWQTVNDEYLYPDFNGLDWNAVHVDYRLRIEEGLSNADFYIAMADMIYSLGDDHSHFLTPEEKTAREVEYTGNLDFVGIGIILSAVPERQRAVIYVVFPGSPAEEAGLHIHDSILAVDGTPILDENGYLSQNMLGPEGTTVSVEVQTPGEEPHFPRWKACGIYHGIHVYGQHNR